MFVQDAARQSGPAVPLASAALQIYATLKEQGLGDLDLAAVRQIIANLSDDAGEAAP